MRFFAISAVVVCFLSEVCLAAATPAEILNRLKAVESKLTDYKAETYIVQADKENVSEMGEGYQDILKLEKAVVSYKKPDKIRYDGYALGMKVTYIQNGYTKLVITSMIRHKDDVKADPGKRQNTLDLGFLSSRLWAENRVSLLSSDKNGLLKLKLVPRWGADNNKRHDLIWVDSKTLRITRREKYRGSGEIRMSVVFSNYSELVKGLPVATTATMFNPKGEKLGTVTYRNIKVNVGLADSLFSLSSR